MGVLKPAASSVTVRAWSEAVACPSIVMLALAFCGRAVTVTLLTEVATSTV
jgi:hypothetical protein